MGTVEKIVEAVKKETTRAVTELEPGCPFAPRCPLMLDECRTAEPELLPVAADHAAACIRNSGAMCVS